MTNRNTSRPPLAVGRQGVDCLSLTNLMALLLISGSALIVAPALVCGAISDSRERNREAYGVRRIVAAFRPLSLKEKRRGLNALQNWRGLHLTQEATRLDPGSPVKRELTGAGRHVYQIKLSAGQFLKVII